MDPFEDVQKIQRFEQISHLFKSAIKGQVLLFGQEGFQSKTALFNAAAKNHCWILVSPLSTQEVVNVVNICRENSLSPSVRSGGFATAGWARQGDVMVDLSEMNQVELRVPSSAELALYSRNKHPLSQTEVGFHSRRKASEAFPSADGEEGSSGGRKKSMSMAPINDDPVLNSSDAPVESATSSRPVLERGSKWSSQIDDSPTIQEQLGTSTKADVSQPVPDAEPDAEARAKLPDADPAPAEPGIDVDVESAEDSNSEGDPSDSTRSKSRTSNSASRSSQVASRSLSTNSNSGSSGLNSNSDSSKPESRANLRKTHTQTSHWVDRLSVPSPVGSWNEGEDTPATSVASGIELNDQDKSSATPVSGDSGWEDPNRSSRQDSGGSGSSNDSNPRLSIPSEVSTPSGTSSNNSSSSSHRRPLYEHERWKRHHRPSTDQASSSKITLPTSGGFIWRSGEGGEAASIISVDAQLSNDQEGSSSSSSSQIPASFAFEGPQPMHPLSGFNGSNHNTLSGLQSTWPDYISSIQNYRTSAGPSTSSASPTIPNPNLSTSRISPPAGTPSLYHGSSYACPSPIPPGLYPQRFALTSFGPGATVRMIDAHTDKAGRECNFALSSGKTSERVLAGKPSKGKGKQVEFEDGVEAEYNNASIGQVARGTPYHCPMSAYPVGSASILTGGFGYLTRSYGLSLDNIVEIELVLADGRVVTLNESSRSRSQEEADLWWAVRGAAPCFGIATRITCKAYPVPSVYSGNLIFPFNPATAGSLICHWRDCLKGGAPRELYSNLILTAGPDASSHVVVIQICYLGSKNEGDPFVHALSSWSGERVLLKDVEERSFLSQQDGVASVLKESLGRRWMIRGDLVTTLTDEFIAKSVLRFRALGIRAVWLFELVGGAVEDLDDSETSIGSTQRGAKFTIAALQQWNESEEDPRCIESVDRWMMEDVSKVSTGGPFPCFLERNEPVSRIAASFGKESFERLRRIKSKVDPDGMFRHTFGKGLVFNEEELNALSSL